MIMLDPRGRDVPMGELLMSGIDAMNGLDRSVYTPDSEFMHLPQGNKCHVGLVGAKIATLGQDAEAWCVDREFKRGRAAWQIEALYRMDVRMPDGVVEGAHLLAGGWGERTTLTHEVVKDTEEFKGYYGWERGDDDKESWACVMPKYLLVAEMLIENEL